MHRASTSTRWHFTFVLCCHSNKTHSPIANAPNSAQSAQQCTTREHHVPFPQLHPGLCSTVACSDSQTNRHTDRQTHKCTWPIYISRHLQLARNVTNTHHHLRWVQTWIFHHTRYVERCCCATVSLLCMTSPNTQAVFAVINPHIKSRHWVHIVQTL